MSSRESTEACRNPKPSFSYNRAAVKLRTKHDGHTNTDPNAITPNKPDLAVFLQKYILMKAISSRSTVSNGYII